LNNHGNSPEVDMIIQVAIPKRPQRPLGEISLLLLIGTSEPGYSTTESYDSDALRLFPFRPQATLCMNRPTHCIRHHISR